MPEPRKTIRHFNDPGHVHFLTFSCCHRLPLLRSDRTRSWFMQALSGAEKNHCFETLAHVIMPEHVHLVIRPLTQDYDVAAILKAIKQPVSRKAKNFLKENNPNWLGRLTVLRGNRRVFRFWQTGPGYDRNIRDDQELIEKVAYIHHNPVRRGLVSSPDEWEWSSAKRYMEGDHEGSEQR